MSDNQAEQNWQERREWFDDYLTCREGQYEAAVAGVSLPLFTCPCCGCPTLTERVAWEICWLCWWEDDGDNTAGLRNARRNFDEVFFYRRTNHVFEMARQVKVRQEGFAAYRKMLTAEPEERIQLWKVACQLESDYYPKSTAVTPEIRDETERRRQAKGLPLP